MGKLTTDSFVSFLKMHTLANYLNISTISFLYLGISGVHCAVALNGLFYCFIKLYFYSLSTNMSLHHFYTLIQLKSFASSLLTHCVFIPASANYKVSYTDMCVIAIKVHIKSKELVLVLSPPCLISASWMEFFK